MELHLGHMTLRELSEWFGYANRDGLSNASKKTKEKKLEILKTYAVYHLEGKKIIIDKIIHPIYTKAFDIIEREFPKEWGMHRNDKMQLNETLAKEQIDTCARVGTVIWSTRAEVNNQIEKSTAKKYANTVKVKQYGHNYKDDQGTKGCSEYVWMNKDNSGPLEGEQLKIFKECIHKAYGTISEQIAAIDTDETLTPEERKEALGEVNTSHCYDDLVELAVDKLGFMPDKMTRLIDRAWENKEKM